MDQPHSFSYVPDVARAMADIAIADDAYGRAWVLPSLSPMTQRELCDALWTAVGNEGPAKIQALRGLGARAIGLFNAPLRASVEMMYEFEKPFIVARDGLREALRLVRDAGRGCAARDRGGDGARHLVRGHARDVRRLRPLDREHPRVRLDLVVEELEMLAVRGHALAQGDPVPLEHLDPLGNGVIALPR